MLPFVRGGLHHFRIIEVQARIVTRHCRPSCSVGMGEPGLMAEAGELYGPGLALMGLSLRRLIVLRVPRPRDALCRPIGREPA